MSYRYEGEDLIIDGWERGISNGPYSIFSPTALGPINQTGTVDLSYGNVIGIPGEFSVQFPLTASTVAGSPPKGVGVPIQSTTEIEDGNGGTVTTYYILDSFGQIFSYNQVAGVVTWTYKGHAGSNSLSIVGNSGIVWWQGYLFTFRGNAVYYSPDGGITNTDWTGTVGALRGSGSTLYAISSKVSDRVYFCNGNGVGAIILTPGTTFDPTNASTYTFYGGTNANMVNIPSYDMSTCLAELNGQILIGGALNRVYPWDAANLAGTGVTSLVGLPLFLGDRYVQRIVVINTNAYVFAGHPTQFFGRGYIYIYSGSTIDVFAKMPDNFTSIGGTVSQIQQPNWIFGDAMWHQNQIVFGAIAYTNGNSPSAITDTGGVWAMDVGSQVLYRMNQMTGGNTVLPTVISPDDINMGGLAYFCGSNGSLNNSTSTLSTPARVISDKIPVGTKIIPKTFSQLEVKMAVALASGETVDVKLITDLDPGGHTIGQMTSADGMSKVFTPFSQSSATSGQQGIQWLQVQAILTPTNSNPTFVRLRDIRLR